MTQFTTWACLGAILLSISVAQSTSQFQCSDLNNRLAWNASRTINVTALRVQGSRPPPNASGLDYSISVQNDTSRDPWNLTLRVSERPSNDGKKYSTSTFYLDTSNSNLTNMGACHNVLGPQMGVNYTFSKSALERSLGDNGDCRVMLGNECVDALRKHYTQEAAAVHMRQGSCKDTNNTVPPECAGVMSMPRTYDVPLNFNLNAFANQTRRNATIPTGLECEDLSVASTHPYSPGVQDNYTVNIKFPTLDILTFWPNRSDMTSYSTLWTQDVRVDILCLLPNTWNAGTAGPASTSALLDDPNAKFAVSAGARTGGGIGWWWTSICVTLISAFMSLGI